MQILKKYCLVGVFMFMGIFAANGAFAADKNCVKFTFGDWKIFAISDAQGKFTTKTFIGLTPELEGKFFTDGNIDSQVNVFFVQNKDKNILIDTGFGLDGARKGRLLSVLKEIGIMPEQVTDIFLTHLHGDHVGGVLNEGKAAFPKAKIWLNSVEKAYWLDKARAEAAPEAAKGAFALAAKAMAAYEGNVNELSKEGEFMPDFSAINTFGHTAGHTSYILKSEGKTLLFAGDMVHAVVLQLQNPNVAVVFDTDAKMAIDTRLKLLEKITTESLPVAGAHIIFPGIGNIKKDGAGYSFKAWE